MNTEYLEQLISGEPLGGFLQSIDGEDGLRIPGHVKLGPDGQITVRLVLEEYSSVLAGLDRFSVIEVNGKRVSPQEIPKVCFFESTGGVLTLIQTGRPRPLGHVMGRPVEVEVSPQYVVAGKLTNDFWKRPVALRAEVGGLSQWMHDSHVTRSISLNVEEDERTGYDTVRLETIDFSAFEHKVTSGKADQWLTIRPLKEHFRSRITDEIGIRFRALVETVDDSASTWEENLHTLHRFQDLVSLLSWRSFKPSNLEGAFLQDTDNNLAFWKQIGVDPPPPPTPVGPWAKVFNSRFPSTFGSPRRKEATGFILPFKDLRRETVAEWFELREEKDHPLELLLQVINQPQMAPPVKALQLGAGLESLGFKLKEAETSKKKADQLRAWQLFELISEPALRLFPNEFETWVSDANEAYQAMKHLSRELPSISKIAKTNDRTSLIVQIWLASTLGASDRSIRDYVEEQSRLRSEYEKVPDPSTLQVGSTGEDGGATST